MDEFTQNNVGLKKVYHNREKGSLRTSMKGDGVGVLAGIRPEIPRRQYLTTVNPKEP